MLPNKTALNNVVHFSGMQSDVGLSSYQYTGDTASRIVDNSRGGGRIPSDVNGMINYG
jgi:hypothetical protein